MPLRRPLLALAAAAAVVAGATAAIASPALAEPSSPAHATVTASFTPATGAATGLVYIKLGSAMSTRTAGGFHLVDGKVTASLAPGRYVIQIANVDDDYQPLTTYATRTFTVRAGQRLALGELKATHRLLTLRGTGPKGGVVTDDFTGWENTGRDVQVAKNGTYVFPGFLPGTYVITAQKRGYADRSYTVRIREPHADLTVGRRLP